MIAAGYVNCAWGWMADYKGFWYNRTELPGCGSGIGLREAPSTQTSAGAYCCHMAYSLPLATPKTYVRSLDHSADHI